jgi:CRISPR-associated protein Csb1
MADSEFSFGGVSLPDGTKRLYITATLVPSTGDPRIQPTGFPDIGPVLYPDPSGKSGENGQICLIESEPSMANHLEEVAFADKYTGTLLPELSGLPYIKVMKSGRFMTASTIDAHRFASKYVLDAKTSSADGGIAAKTALVNYVKTELGIDPSDGTGNHVPAENVPGIFRLAMELDPMSLIHGFQISSDKLAFVGLRSSRALTGCIVGLNAQPVGVPGIAFNPVATGKEAEGYQPIFRKERIVAETIQAKFSLDIGLLTSLPVGAKPAQHEKDHATNEARDHRRRLLVAVSLWKVAKFLKELSHGHRLRSECDLALESVNYRTKWKDGTDASFPFEEILTHAVRKHGDKAAAGSLQDLIAKAGLPASRSPLTLEFGS